MTQSNQPQGSGTPATMKPQRECPGSYRYRGWIINRVQELHNEWVAYREDDKTWVLDPLPTLRDAVTAINHNPDPGANVKVYKGSQLLWTGQVDPTSADPEQDALDAMYEATGETGYAEDYQVYFPS